MAKKPSDEKKHELFAFKHELLEKSRAENEPDELELLKRRVDALWVLLQNKLGLTEEQLQAEITRHEAALAAEREAAAKVEIKNCPKCGRALSLKTNTCIYCGGDEKTVAEALKRFGGKSS